MVRELFIKMGAEPKQASVMASQLLKRAAQIAKTRNISIIEATGTLLKQVFQAREGDGIASDSDSET